MFMHTMCLFLFLACSVEPSTDNKNSNKKDNEKKVWEPFRLIMKKHRSDFADFISSLGIFMFLYTFKHFMSNLF